MGREEYGRTYVTDQRDDPLVLTTSGIEYCDPVVPSTHLLRSTLTHCYPLRRIEQQQLICALRINFDRWRALNAQRNLSQIPKLSVNYVSKKEKK